MNVLFFLIPKENVAYIYDDFTVRQALEKMKHYHYTAIPMIDRDGHYVGTVTEGDFLWGMLEHNSYTLKDAETWRLSDLPLRRDNLSVKIDANIEDLMHLVFHQNFVPVVDNYNIFIGIVTRRDIMQYFFTQVFPEKDAETEQQAINS